MTGDVEDMLRRLKAVLPTGWFPDSAPVLDNLLRGLGSGWSWIFSLHSYVRRQTRVSTADGVWLDVAANDYFGTRLRRRVGEPDDLYRVRISRELLRERGTRAAVRSALTDLTGRAPAIFEPANPGDTGGYGSALGDCGGGIAYCGAGGWGSLSLPFQFFVTAFRPHGGGIADVAGWCVGPGGYCAGAIQYGDLSMIGNRVSDEEILEEICAVTPVATIAWSQIQG
jgi:hypothetical protein